MKNFADISKTNSQLEKAYIQKSRIISNVHRAYELYLKLLRDLLYISVEKGLNELFSYLSNKDNSSNASTYFCFFEKKIRKLIYTYIPLFTLEQLKINEIEKNINKKIYFNSLESSIKIKDDQNEKFQYDDGCQFGESFQFQVNENISTTSEYYQAENHEKFESFDLDNNEHNNFLLNNNIFENIGLEEQFISSLLELIEEFKVEKQIHSEKENINEMDFSPNFLSLKIFDLIDNSLENLLLSLSYKINQELFKANLIKKIISRDSFEYLITKKLMIKHPQPFVINFDLNMNQFSSKSQNIPSITLLNISTVELEFKNLNLSIQRNKINELKNQFQRLNKKEKYWRQKEISLNKIL